MCFNFASFMFCLVRMCSFFNHYKNILTMPAHKYTHNTQCALSFRVSMRMKFSLATTTMTTAAAANAHTHTRTIIYRDLRALCQPNYTNTNAACACIGRQNKFSRLFQKRWPFLCFSFARSRRSWVLYGECVVRACEPNSLRQHQSKRKKK